MLILWTVNQTNQINPMLFCMMFYEIFCLYNIITGIILKKHNNSKIGIILLLTGLFQGLAAYSIMNINNSVFLLLSIVLSIVFIRFESLKIKTNKNIINIIELIGTLIILTLLILYILK